MILILARPGTDLSVPLKNIVNEYYSKDLSKKVETGKAIVFGHRAASAKERHHMGGYRATDGSRKLLIDEEVSDNVVRDFQHVSGWERVCRYCKNSAKRRNPCHRNTDFKAGKTEFAEKQGNGTIHT